MAKMNHEQRNRMDGVGYKPRARRKKGTKQQHAARRAAMEYQGDFDFMLSMRREALFNDDWLPSPRQAQAIENCMKYVRPLYEGVDCA